VIGQRREELVQKIAVRRVDLQAIQAQPRRAPRGFDKGVADAREACGIECDGRIFRRGMRHG
jgi:hypothetical protein